jgi:hypothetical protein
MAAYRAEKARIEATLATLRPAKNIDMQRAVELVQNFSMVWGRANDQERSNLLHTAVDEVYVENGVVRAIKPKGLS